jgi:hypothetical protein
MRMKPVFRVLALGACLAACAAPPQPTAQRPAPLMAPKESATVPQLSLGAIAGWERQPDGAATFTGTSGKTFRATFTDGCPQLDATPPPKVTAAIWPADRFSGVVVGRYACYFDTLKEVIDPKSRAIAAPSAEVDGTALPPPTR